MKQVPDSRCIFIFRFDTYTLIRGFGHGRTFEKIISSTDEREIRRIKQQISQELKRKSH